MKAPSSPNSIRPKRAYTWFRTWLGKVWKVRGGGLYAVGYAATFVYLEIRTIVGELIASDGIVDFLSEQLLEFVFRFLGESFVNMVQAFIWPVQIIQLRPPFGAIGLGIAFVVFDRFLRKPIEQHLFDDE